MSSTHTQQNQTLNLRSFIASYLEGDVASFTLQLCCYPSELVPSSDVAFRAKGCSLWSRRTANFGVRRGGSYLSCGVLWLVLVWEDMFETPDA